MAQAIDMGWGTREGLRVLAFCTVQTSMPAEPNETRYQTIEPIAPFAAIFTKAEDTQTGQVVVLKKLRMGFDEGVSAEALREISIMKELQHEHVVGVLDVFFDPEDKVCLVLQHHRVCPTPSLACHLAPHVTIIFLFALAYHLRPDPRNVCGLRS